MTLRLYHLTPAGNLPAIMTMGLQPRLGARSIAGDEPRPAIYLFATMSELDYALEHWLGDQFAEDEALALLEVLVSDDAVMTRTAFEVRLDRSVPPERLRLLSVDYGR